MVAPGSNDDLSRVVHTLRGEVVVRAALEGDADDYRQIRLEALRDHPDAFGTAYEKAAALPAESWPERLREAGKTTPKMFMAWTATVPVGLCGLAREEGIKVMHNADLISMYVRPQWRSLGIADTLIEATLEWGRRIGVLIVRLGVVGHNESALRVYERLGFQRYGTEPAYIHHGGSYHDMILMFKRL